MLYRVLRPSRSPPKPLGWGRRRSSTVVDLRPGSRPRPTADPSEELLLLFLLRHQPDAKEGDEEGDQTGDGDGGITQTEGSRVSSDEREEGGPGATGGSKEEGMQGTGATRVVRVLYAHAKRA